MASTSRKRQGRKVDRRIGWVPGSWQAREGFGILRIVQEGKPEHYFLRVVPCEYGCGFEMTKLVPRGDVYHIALSAGDGKHSCECKGFLRWGHCKHVEGLVAMAEAGKLAGPAASKEAA